MSAVHSAQHMRADTFDVATSTNVDILGKNVSQSCDKPYMFDGTKSFKADLSCFFSLFHIA